MISAMLTMLVVGAVCGLLLGIASIAFHVEPDHRAEELLAMLPGYNCGGCGYPGCSGMAAALADGSGDVEKCKPSKAEAKAAGADYVGLDEYIEKIKGGWTDIDVIITMPSIMGKMGALGRVLGPRGLMPNPKSGTVTNEIGKAVKEVKQGKIDFKVDKNGIVHAAIAKVSFDAEKIAENAKEFITTLNKLKPTAAKGVYIKSVYLSSTMSQGVKVDPKSAE